MTDQTTQPTGLLQNEPVLLTHAISSVIAFAGTSVGLDQSGTSRLVNLIVPGAVALALMLQGVVLRRWVGPAWKIATADIKKSTGVDLTGDVAVAEFMAMLGLAPDGSPLATPKPTSTTPVPMPVQLGDPTPPAQPTT